MCNTMHGVENVKFTFNLRRNLKKANFLFLQYYYKDMSFTPKLPLKSFPIYLSSIIIPFYATLSEILSVSLHKLHINKYV